MLAPTHNKTIVPWTSPWTGESHGYVVRQEHYLQGAWSLCQAVAPGEGTPIFGSAHYQRQRQAIVQGRCDVCGRMISPGQARVLLHPGNRLKGTNEVGHVMAPSHRACARQAASVCPWIIAKIEDGSLTVTVVRKSHVALAILDPDVVEAEIGKRVAVQVVGHAKLIIDKGAQRDADWLLRPVAA